VTMMDLPYTVVQLTMDRNGHKSNLRFSCVGRVALKSIDNHSRSVVSFAMWKRISGAGRAFASAAPLFLPIRHISRQLARPGCRALLVGSCAGPTEINLARRQIDSPRSQQASLAPHSTLAEATLDAYGSFLTSKLPATDKMRVEGDLSTAHLHHVRTGQQRIIVAIIIDHEDGFLIRPDHA
jgi:hypothetical protein